MPHRNELMARGGGRLRPGRLPATDQGCYVGGLDRPRRPGPGERRTAGTTERGDHRRLADCLSIALGPAREEQRIALTQRARFSRPLASALIPGAPRVCRYLPCSKAQAESRNLGSNGNRRVYPILAAHFCSFNAADRAIAKSRLADQGLWSDMTSDSRPFERYRRSTN